jgi:tetratricopeptide (TPR) repeat protein
VVLKGRIYYWLDRVNDALRCYEEAISIDPNYSEGFLERARLLYAVRQEHRRALRDVRKAVGRAGRDRRIKGEALCLQGHILDALDLESEAITSYRAALRVSPKDARTHEALGNTLLLPVSP